MMLIKADDWTGGITPYIFIPAVPTNIDVGNNGELIVHLCN